MCYWAHLKLEEFDFDFPVKRCRTLDQNPGWTLEIGMWKAWSFSNEPPELERSQAFDVCFAVEKSGKFDVTIL